MNDITEPGEDGKRPHLTRPSGAPTGNTRQHEGKRVGMRQGLRRGWNRCLMKSLQRSGAGGCGPRWHPSQFTQQQLTQELANIYNSLSTCDPSRREPFLGGNTSVSSRKCTRDCVRRTMRHLAGVPRVRRRDPFMQGIT